jgi:hypothetical protein
MRPVAQLADGPFSVIEVRIASSWSGTSLRNLPTSAHRSVEIVRSL